MIYLLGDVEPAFYTSHMRHKGVQDVLCEAQTHPISSAREQVKIGLSREKMKQVDSALSELSLTITTVRSTQLAIERGGLILPAFRQRLQRVKWWLDGDIQQLSQYKVKCIEEGTTLLCDVASQTVQLANNEIIRIMQECGSSLDNEMSHFICPHAVSELVNMGRDAASA